MITIIRKDVSDVGSCMTCDNVSIRKVYKINLSKEFSGVNEIRLCRVCMLELINNAGNYDYSISLEWNDDEMVTIPKKEHEKLLKYLVS